jgi:hypothetical protein
MRKLLKKKSKSKQFKPSKNSTTKNKKCPKINLRIFLVKFSKRKSSKIILAFTSRKYTIGQCVTYNGLGHKLILIIIKTCDKII